MGWLKLATQIDPTFSSSVKRHLMTWIEDASKWCQFGPDSRQRGRFCQPANEAISMPALEFVMPLALACYPALSHTAGLSASIHTESSDHFNGAL